MKNLKMRAKLLISFAIVIVLASSMSTISILSAQQLDTTYSAVLDRELKTVYQAGAGATAVANQRSDMLGILAFAQAGDREGVERMEASLSRHIVEFEATKVAFAALIDTTDAKLMSYVSAILEHNDSLDTHKAAFLDAIEAGEAIAALEVLQSATADFDGMQENFVSLYDYVMDAADAQSQANTLQLEGTVTALIIAQILVIAVSIALTLYLSYIVSSPLKKMLAAMEQAGGTGNMEFSADVMRDIEQAARYRDEIGTSLKSFHKMLLHMVDISRELGHMSQGDMSRTVSTLSPDDTMGNAMNHMIENINDMFGEISLSSDQVSTGSAQIADGAQALAQGATEQAASVEELSSSIAEVAASIKLAAEAAGSASVLADSIKDKAQRGSTQMEHMMAAVREINEASANISKVISVIDNIAFQTNLLALNASVEAAKAGQHGRGFAVVAEEVRTLATKSAEAAKDTGTLIASSIEKAEMGTRIAGETSASLEEIVQGINQSSQIVGEIARSAEEQTSAIGQINTGIDQVAQVVQQNSATAQESAAASHQMSVQSSALQSLVGRFRLRDSAGSRRTLPTGGRQGQEAPEDEDAPPVRQAEGLGKY